MGLGFGIRDSGSGKNLFRIPDPGVKNAPDPGSGSATMVFSFVLCNVADPDSGSGTFMSPGLGSGMGKKIRIRVRDEQPGSYFRELRNNFLGLIYLNALMEKNSDPQH